MDSIILIYIRLKTHVTRWYMNRTTNIFDIQSITYYDNNDNKIKNGMYLYYLIKNINYFIEQHRYLSNRLIELRNKVDIQTNKIQLIKNINNDTDIHYGCKTIILTPNKINNNNQSMSINDIVTYVENNTITKDSNMPKYIYMKFDLIYPNNKSICIRDFIVKYKDVNEEFDHTLKNILIFNNIDLDDTLDVKIQMFNNGKMINKVLHLSDVCDKHINWFNQLE